MALPKLSVKQYSFELPSSGEKVLFRPFTVKEEKILLQALEENEEAQVLALRQVINNCLLTPLDVDKLPMFDLDYLWIKLRSKSVQEIVHIPFECRNALPDGKTRIDEDGDEVDYCGTVVNVAVNLETIQVKRNPKNNPKIEIEPGIGIVLRYPTFEMVKNLAKMDENNIQAVFDVIMECTSLIYEGEKAYEREYIEKAELQEFLENLSQKQFQRIMEFFETMPVLSHQVHFKCPKCGHEVDITVEGTKSFLASDSPTNQ